MILLTYLNIAQLYCIFSVPKGNNPALCFESVIIFFTDLGTANLKHTVFERSWTNLKNGKKI